MRKILVIEDNMVNSYLIESILKNNGYIVIQTACASRGIELVAEEMPELIIVDIHIADMDGLESVLTVQLSRRNQTRYHRDLRLGSREKQPIICVCWMINAFETVAFIRNIRRG